MPERNRVRLVAAAREENVAIARSVAAQVATLLDFTLPELEELRIAVSEAVSNAVLHAYGPDGADGEVEITFALDAEALDVEVRDAGRGIDDVEKARQAEFSTLEGHLGLGFAFMEAMTDELSVQSAPGRGTVVHMRKRPHGAPPEPGPPFP
jgi:stage II sporulation protein AB (anti-sigma F factor)